MILSIITINFNNLEGLKKTAESVINQTWKDFEWIIIDGGSTDGSKEYIENLAGTLSHENNITGTSWNIERFSIPGFTSKEMKEYASEFSLQDNNGARKLLWCSERDKGIYNAMNKGIAQASGSYLNFMNSGDCFYDCDTLEKVSAYLNEGNSDVYYGDITIVADDYTLIEQRVYKEFLDIYDLFFSTPGHQAQYFRTSILRNSCYDERYKIAGDQAKNIEFLMKDFSFLSFTFYAAIFDNNGVGSKYNENTEPERERIKSECFPNSVLSVLLRLYKYENGHIYQRVNNIMVKGGVLSLFLRFFLKIAGKKKAITKCCVESCPKLVYANIHKSKPTLGCLIKHRIEFADVLLK